jgi:hypothetical protein
LVTRPTRDHFHVGLRCGRTGGQAVHAHSWTESGGVDCSCERATGAQPSRPDQHTLMDGRCNGLTSDSIAQL